MNIEDYKIKLSDHIKNCLFKELKKGIDYDKKLKDYLFLIDKDKDEFILKYSIDIFAENNQRNKFHKETYNEQAKEKNYIQKVSKNYYPIATIMNDNNFINNFYDKILKQNINPEEYAKIEYNKLENYKDIVSTTMNKAVMLKFKEEYGNKSKEELKKFITDDISNKKASLEESINLFSSMFADDIINKTTHLNKDELYKYAKEQIKPEKEFENKIYRFILDYLSKKNNLKVKAFKLNNNNNYYKLSNLHKELKKQNFIDSASNEFKNVFDEKKGSINWIGDGAKSEIVYFYYSLLDKKIITGYNKHSIAKTCFTVNGEKIEKKDNTLKTLYNDYSNNNKALPKRSKEIDKIIKDVFSL